MNTPDSHAAETLKLCHLPPRWLVDHYALIDAADVEGYGRNFTDDITVRFGALPPVRGKSAVLAALGGDHEMYAMEHAFRHVWTADQCAVIQLEVRFTVRDGRAQTVPAITFIHHDNYVMDDIQVFIDRAPLVGLST